MGGTVKQFYEAIEEMRSIYPFRDSEARLRTDRIESGEPNQLTIITRDEKTGIYIRMTKEIPAEGY